MKNINLQRILFLLVSLILIAVLCRAWQPPPTEQPAPIVWDLWLMIYFEDQLYDCTKEVIKLDNTDPIPDGMEWVGAVTSWIAGGWPTQNGQCNSEKIVGSQIFRNEDGMLYLRVDCSNWSIYGTTVPGATISGSIRYLLMEVADGSA